MASAGLAPQQIAKGKGIAQAIGPNTSATVNYYELAQPEPLDDSKLAAALAKLDTMPLDRLPEPAPLPRSSRMLLAHNPLFVGRQDDLLRLARTLKGGQIVAIGQTAAATGLGGIGKTQLAVEFAHRYGQFFTGGVFWLSFASAETVPAEVAACGGVGAMDLRPDFSNLKQDEQAAAVSSKWQDGLPRLLVFDTCESQELLARWQPPSGRCHVLVTSRRAEWDPALGMQALTLDVLPRAESVALLRGFRPDLSVDDHDLDAIAADLGDLPLALHLAGSYLHRYARSPLGAPPKLLAELRNPQLLEHQALTGAGESLSPTGHEMHVARTFAISYDQLRPDDATDTLASKALANAACMAPSEPIPRALLLLTLKLERTQSVQGEDALHRLASLGLVETERDGAVRLHRLLVAFVKRITPGNVAAAEVVEEVLQEEASRIVSVGYPGPLQAWQVHLRWVADQAEKRGSPQTDLVHLQLGRYLRLVGDFLGARAALERALKTTEAAFGPGHPNVAAVINNLSGVVQDLGDFADARVAIERALQIDEAAYGPNHPFVGTDINNLGLVLYYQGDLLGARAAIERALRIDEAAHDPDHPDVGRDINNLALVLQAQDDLAGAQSAFQRALEITISTYGPNHPKVATIACNLGSILRDQGNFASARAAVELALAIDEVVYGLEHPDVARDLNTLGGVLMAQGDLTGASAAFERALKIDEVAYGPAHPDVARDMNNLGSLLRARGDIVGARATFERALRILEHYLGPEHPKTQIVRKNLMSLQQG